jgi:membrane metallo-endopeptidase-like protein 1
MAPAPKNRLEGPEDQSFLPPEGCVSVLPGGRAEPAASLLCPWAKAKVVACRRHRTAWDLCGLILILLLCLVLILVLCFLHPCLWSAPLPAVSPRAARPPVCLTPECVQTAASLLGAMDRTTDPCDNFFQFACGDWNRKHIIPEDRSSVSPFDVLGDQLQIILKGLLEKPRQTDDSEISHEAKHLYQSCVNMSSIVHLGDAPIRATIAQLGGWPVTFPPGQWRPPPSLEAIVARVRSQYNAGILVDLWVGPDDRNSDEHVVQIDQPQLGLPSRDYFLQPRSQRNLAAYHRYMTQAGRPPWPTHPPPNHTCLPTTLLSH